MSGTVVSADVPAVPVESTKPRIAAGVRDSKEIGSNLEKQLEQLHISDSQHVIIPNHIHVPEADKLGFCFGSFDANFGMITHNSNASEREKNTLPEISEKIEEIVEEQLRCVKFLYPLFPYIIFPEHELLHKALYPLLHLLS